MNVLTVWQPWASLVAIGAKPYEFRGRTPPPRYVGQRIGINAGARKIVLSEVREIIEQLTRAPWESCLEVEKALPLLEGVLSGKVLLPRGVIVCTALLGAARNGFDIAAEFGMPAGMRPNDSDRAQHANFGWPLTAIEEVVPPEPHRGLQGWSQWNPGGRHVA